MGIQSAASPCFVNERWSHSLRRLGVLLAWLISSFDVATAQLTTGILKGILRTSDGLVLIGESIPVTGSTGFRATVVTGSQGDFSLTLPYGRYQLSGSDVAVAPLEATRVELIRDRSGAIRVLEPRSALADSWTGHPRALQYPEAFSLQSLLLNREPSTVTQPLDFTGLSDNRFAVASMQAFSWTGVHYELHGLDATDPYQPGFPTLLPNVWALETIAVQAFAQPTSSGYGTDLTFYLAEPPASWHGALSTVIGSHLFAWSNLPPFAERGLVQQADQFQWFTRDQVEVGGPLGRRVDLYASASGQWASQTEPLAPPGTNQDSRLLFGNACGRVRATSTDRFDALFAGSRIDLSDGGLPAGLPALSSNRLAPSFDLPGGFFGQSEEDHLDAIQVGWTHFLPAGSGAGSIEVRYGYSVAHLDTRTSSTGSSRVELLGGAVTGSPPLANLAVRTRHEIAGAWQPALQRTGTARHQIAAGGSWRTSEPRNRFGSPSDRNVITADGAAAFIVEFNTPVNSTARVSALAWYAADHITLQRSLSLDIAAVADLWRGSLPAQSSPAGSYAPTRNFAARNDLVNWKSLSPRAGFAWQVPGLHALTLRGAYSRRYAPMAGRYLDFGNPNSLAGSVYKWITPDLDSPFQASQRGELVLRFGGPYSSISPGLARPYTDKFDLGAELRIGRSSAASIHLFRGDEKNRIAALDAGLPARAFTPVSIPDPGPDGISGTFDDQLLTVYAQDPGTFGQDHYQLTNPPGLRELNSGLVAQTGTELRGLTIHASFVAEKSYGPTNPGNAFYENDPGVIGGLFLDPNAAVNVAGRTFMDRAYVGKAQIAYRLPASYGGFELASVADYTDGLVFARRLLVTTLPQGPFVAATTVRGSPGGGNRAQYAFNWNIRISRRFGVTHGMLNITADILNVTNARQSLQEIDLSGPSFNLRLPVAIEPSRFVLLGFRYEF